MSARQKEKTTLGVYSDTHRRFNEAKPGPMSSDEFVNVLLRRWEGDR